MLPFFHFKLAEKPVKLKNVEELSLMLLMDTGEHSIMFYHQVSLFPMLSLVTRRRLTWTRNFHREPTGTPGTGP